MTEDIGNGHRLGADFVRAISSAARHSTAVDHPYLQAIQSGDLPNVRLALQDFAFQYGLYSANFVNYMSAVVGNLNNPEHKNILLANLAEENGETHDADLPPEIRASVVGEPHAMLYRRFQIALGLGAGSVEATPDCPGLLWSREFLQLCQMNACVGIGAIGIGTELIVASIYNQILDGLKAHSDLTPTERVFFDLHSVCDDEHAAQMQLITESLADDAVACEQIEYGVKAALDMRATFWDRMLIRARRFCASESLPTERVAAGGHRNSL